MADIKRWSIFIALLLTLAVTSGCSSSIYGWQVRTSSTAFSPSFDPGSLGQESVGVFGALTMPGLRGNEVGLDFMLGEVLHRVAPHIQIVSQQQTISKINQLGLAAEYAQMRADAEQSHILNRDPLKKLGTAIGARYVFQPRLAAFTQTMYDRWTFPGLGVVVSQTRQSSEALAKDPVYLEDAVRVTLGSIVADFLNRKTASTYTPLNKIVDGLIQIPMPEVKSQVLKPGQ
jgi:hypothetical protein